MRLAPISAALLAALIAAGCGGTTKKTSSPPPSPARASLAVTSDFRPGATIPRVHTCDGRDVSPPLRAAGLPAATSELAIVMRDPDAPGGDFIHWGIAHVRASDGALSLPVAAKPAGAVLARNSFGSIGYRGPCPPPGDGPHHYVVTVYALGRPSSLKSGFSADALTALPALAKGTLTGVYARR